MNPYETIYRVGLLDDLHNYFPALLYDSSAFVSVADVLQYIQRQTRRRFDLFSVGASAYYDTRPLRTTWQEPVHVRQVYVPQAGQTATPSLRVQTTFDDVTTTNAVLQFIMRGMTESMSPVIVRASAEELSAATTESSYTLTDVAVCSVCQDNIQRNENIRKINHCSHFFHKNCIDLWFQQNVRCPVCRYDIRDRPSPTGPEA